MIDVTCAIILKGEKILVTQRSKKMNLPLKWEFPGGKIEHNETPEECLQREAREELKLEIEFLKKLEARSFAYETFSINLIPFITNYISGEIYLTEHKDFKWLAIEELIFLDWSPADIPVVEDFLKLNYDTTRAL
jgi:8-oxo-dGTP diphosphatase